MTQKLKLADYTEPTYWTKKTDLNFDLFDDHTIVTSTLTLVKNLSRNENEVILDGDGQEVLFLALDGVELDPKNFLKDKELHLSLNAKQHLVTITTKIYPHANKSFEGLYKSNNKYFTQCEAEGFRKITYYQDRPDVLSKFTVTITASGYSAVLSNGNLVKEEVVDGKTRVTWEDPFPKPAYLFALVAGNFDKITDHFVTRSGRNVLLEVYVDEGMKSRAHHAMKSLKESMQWDEERYDLEYDLDRFMIVAANDFNFGAMENKGLNIFNAKYALADRASATDIDFYNIQAVVGHEYFHNWTGNRVTCRDWFQLSLKEGLTVYRDQEFSSDLNSRGVKRIDDVICLRISQFTEDAGGNSHPVRPSEAFNISNFYTATIYEKGAELIRMIETLIGRDAFKKGIAKYFELFDGQAVTTEDFCFAMSEASGRDLTFFQKWYTQKGTPKLEVRKDVDSQKLSLHFHQTTKPLLLPILTGFISKDGRALKDVKILSSTCAVQLRDESLLFEITKAEETIVLDLPKDTRVSLLRDFSAPITLRYFTDAEEIYDVAAFDTNSFCRWEALQQLISKDILKNIDLTKNAKSFNFDEKLISVFKRILTEPISDPAYTAKLFSLPTVDNIKLEFDTTYPLDEILLTLKEFKNNIGLRLATELASVYKKSNKDSSGDRALKNTLLSILCTQDQFIKEAEAQYQSANNMTDQLGALDAMKNSKSSSFKICLENFHKKWSNDSLVYMKYLMTVFSRQDSHVLQDFQMVHKDPAFQNWNPNHNYSSYAVMGNNAFVFHDKSGLGYKILANRIKELDVENPYVAARLANAFNDYKKLDSQRASLMKVELDALLKAKLSSNTYEIIHNALN
jgi:aminopeptidase N